MKRIPRFTKRTWVLLGIVAAVAAIASIGAYAYWTSSGSGTGSATAGDAQDNLFVTGTAAGFAYPGGPGQTVSFTVANPENFNQSISNIHLVDVNACTVAWDYTDPANPTCDGGSPFVGDIPGCGGANSTANDFQMADVAVDPADEGDIGPNATAQSLNPTTGLLVMNNLSSDQNDCKNAYLNLNFTTT